jgi:membrane protein
VDVPGAPRPDYGPTGGDTSTTHWGVVRRTFSELQEDHLTDWAAALTYYGVLALFPAVIAIVSVIGLVADPQETTRTLTDVAASLGPETASETFRGPIESITANRSRAGIGLVAGLLIALWSASGYVGAFVRASSVIYETPEGRPFWKLRPMQVLVTLVMVLLAAAVALSLVLTGPVVDAVSESLGIGDTAVTSWSLAKWPVILVVVVLMVCLIYYATPNMRQRGFRWLFPGALLAVGVWFVASVGFAFFVANFGSYDRTYGALAGVIVFLIWLFVTNFAMLLGAELNSERERRAELLAGVQEAAVELQREPRSEPKRPRTR